MKRPRSEKKMMGQVLLALSCSTPKKLAQYLMTYGIKEDARDLLQYGAYALVRAIAQRQDPDYFRELHKHGFLTNAMCLRAHLELMLRDGNEGPTEQAWQASTDILNIRPEGMCLNVLDVIFPDAMDLPAFRRTIKLLADTGMLDIQSESSQILPRIKLCFYRWSTQVLWQSQVTEAVHFLLGYGYSSQAADSFDLIMCAEASSDISLIKRLVKNGAEIHSRGYMPIFVALHSKNYVVADYLIKAAGITLEDLDPWLSFANMQTIPKEFIVWQAATMGTERI